VVIVGNQAISLARLQSAVSSGDMSTTGEISKSITALYYDSGFVEVRLSAKEDAERILIDVNEGDQFRFGNLRIDGPDKRSLPRPRFERGDVFSRSKMMSYLTQIRAYFAEVNREVVVNPITEVHQESKTVDITVQIVETKALRTSDSPGHACVPTKGIGIGEPLVLSGTEEVVLGPAHTYRFRSICVGESARIRVCSSARIHLPRNARVVIGGRGVGGFGVRRTEVLFESLTYANFFVLFDDSKSRIRANLRLPQAKSFYYATASRRLQTDGKGPLDRPYPNAAQVEKNIFPSCL
jgi:hypothetical protein